MAPPLLAALAVAGLVLMNVFRDTERCLHPWRVLFVVPLLAFFNAGIVIDGNALASFFAPVSLGVAGGLFPGKQLGVPGAAWAAVSSGFGQLPMSVSWAQLYGAALLAGIGFTMSLFASSLAFADPAMVASAKLSVLVGSLLSAIAGLIIVHMATRSLRQTPACRPTLRGPPQ